MKDKTTALSRVRRQLVALEELATDDDDGFSRWFRATRVAAERTFGEESKQVKEFTSIYFVPPIATHKTTDADRQWWHESGLRKAKRLLEAFIDEISEYWDEEDGHGGADDERGSTVQIKLFISHRSTDKELAKAIADLLRNATRLASSEIRCTSVDGYRLPGGADTAAQLRDEVLEAAALIGLITPSSVSSAYVLFELGARWGAGKHLCPVLARGADDQVLGGPLGGRNALHLNSRAEVIQMVEEVAATVDVRVESWASVQHDIDEVVRLAGDAAPKTPLSSAPPKDEATVDDVELHILRLLSAQPESRPDATEIAEELQLGLERARYHLRRLETAGSVDYVEIWGTGARHYFLAQPGREVLVRRGLL